MQRARRATGSSMQTPTPLSVSLLVLLLGAGQGVAQVEPPPEPSIQAAETAATPPLSRAALALDRALQRGWRDLRLQVECRMETGFLSADIYGNGVGIWNRKRQFTLAPEAVRSLLEILREGELAAMPDVLGSGGRPGRPGSSCRIALHIDHIAKQVAQALGGEAPGRLRPLAGRLFEAIREAGRTGTTAADLEDALAKIADRRLAVEALSLRSRRRPSAGDLDEEGWVLSLHGSVAVSRSFSPREGYGPEMRLRLEADAVRAIARRLAAHPPGDLPAVTADDVDTSVHLEALQHELGVQVRRADSAKLAEPQDHQERLGRLIEEIRRLHRRVLSDGLPVRQPTTR